jgi:hypothetical protein
MKIKLSDRGRLILVAVTLVMLIMLVAFTVPTRYLEKFQWKWFRFSLEAVICVSIMLRIYWKLRRSLVFWCIFAGFLCLHILGVGYYYYMGPGLGVLAVGLVYGIETICMAIVIYWILRTGPGLREHNSQSPWTPTL